MKHVLNKINGRKNIEHSYLMASECVGQTNRARIKVVY